MSASGRFCFPVHVASLFLNSNLLSLTPEFNLNQILTIHFIYALFNHFANTPKITPVFYSVPHSHLTTDSSTVERILVRLNSLFSYIQREREHTLPYHIPQLHSPHSCMPKSFRYSLPPQVAQILSLSASGL